MAMKKNSKVNIKVNGKLRGTNQKNEERLSSQSNDNISSNNKFINPIAEFVNGIDDSFLWHLKKEGEKEIVFYTNNILKVTGYSGEELKHFPGRGNAIVFEEDQLKVKKIFAEFIDDPSKDFIKLIYRIIRKDKKIIWIVESVSVKRNNDGHAFEFNGIVTDITELKETELSLERSLDNFRQLNSSKDKFISMLSHDLRAPFTSILGFSEILINEPNLTNEERLEYLNYINDSSQNQLQLVNYLLDWSRLQTGRIKIEPQRLNAQSIVFNCISSLTGNAIRKNLEIKVQIKDSLFVQADERLLTQVITNLLSNAIKYSPEGKTIEIAADFFNEKFVEFIVKDEGLGISESNKAKLFKIEKMFSTEGTKGEKGTGLGLSLVREIIEKHDGEIWFYSDLGKGSEFHFTIPSSPNTILLVVGECGERKRYESILIENFPAYQIISVKNGYEALSHYLTQLPSLIITDYDLPLMNGIQFIESIRREDKGGRIAIIALVSDVSEDIRREYNLFGVETILQKPVDEDLFSEKIQVVLEYQ
ncbi:MAG: ATP-binding protein [Bacteroidetes bacterium]|nr:ATP-binding protein [Bacteroidota bacterium]